MNQKIIRLAITGAYGRMGSNIIKNTENQKNIILSFAIVKKKKNDIYIKKNEKIKIIENIKEIENKINEFDVLIDFSTPKTTLQYLKICKLYNKNIVIGTTGFKKEEMKIIENYSKKIGIVFSSNFSIGINLIFEILKKISHTLDESYDIEIIESHHRNKLDSPSGTALQMGKIIAKEKKWDLKKYSIYRKKDNLKTRERNKIGFSIIRSGDIIGEHNVMFSGIGERIEIKHKASSRNTFSKGAIKAALWIHKKKKGLYSMKHVLNI